MLIDIIIYRAFCFLQNVFGCCRRARHKHRFMATQLQKERAKVFLPVNLLCPYFGKSQHLYARCVL